MHRIFFDTNEGSHSIGYWLHLKKSREDLDGIKADLVNGLRVIIYMPEELEMEANLLLDAEVGTWLAMPIDGTIRYLSE